MRNPSYWRLYGHSFAHSDACQGVNSSRRNTRLLANSPLVSHLTVEKCFSRSNVETISNISAISLSLRIEA
jgi:hypothetical protein